MADSPPAQPSLAYVDNLKLVQLVFTLLGIFFASCGLDLAYLAYQIRSPIHILAFFQACVGVFLALNNLLYTFLLTSCTAYYRINITAIGIVYIAIYTIISIQVRYIYSKSRPILFLLIIYTTAYLSFLAYVISTYTPVFTGSHCYSGFPIAVPSIKLGMDLFANIVLSGMIVLGIRRLAIESGTGFWHHIIVERVYYIITLLLINITSALLNIFQVIGLNSDLLYFIDWICACGLVTYQLKSASVRREKRLRGSLEGEIDSVDIAANEAIALDRISHSLEQAERPSSTILLSLTHKH